MAGSEKRIHMNSFGGHDHSKAMERARRVSEEQTHQEPQAYQDLADLLSASRDVDFKLTKRKLVEEWKRFRNEKPQPVFLGFIPSVKPQEPCLSPQEMAKQEQELKRKACEERQRLLKEFVRSHLTAVAIFSHPLSEHQETALRSFIENTLSEVQLTTVPQNETGTDNR